MDIRKHKLDLLKQFASGEIPLADFLLGMDLLSGNKIGILLECDDEPGTYFDTDTKERYTPEEMEAKRKNGLIISL